MSFYFPTACDALPAHHYDPCEDKEYGRIRSAGFIYKYYDLTNPASTTQWHDGIASGQIIVIRETNGESPKASPILAPPYGPHAESVVGYTFSASFTDPNYNSNCRFYNQVIGNMNYRFFYRTSSHIYITSSVVAITPNREIKNDLTSEISWSVDVKWLDRQFPCGWLTPDAIFDREIPLLPAPGTPGSTTPDHGSGGGKG